MRRRAFVLLFSALVGLLGAASPVLAQERGIQIREIDPDRYPDVTVVVSLPRPVEPTDIRVTENDRNTTILHAGPLITSGREIDIILAIDASNSVRGAALEAAVAAAESFVSSLPQGVPVAVVTFGRGVRLLSDFSTDRSTVLQQLGTIGETEGGTAMFDAVVQASEMFSGPAQHNLIVLTDGRDRGSANTLDDAIAVARRANASVFTVGLEGGKTPLEPFLGPLAEETGGSFSATSKETVGRLYQELAGRLRHQYLIRYRSFGPPAAQVTVRVHALGFTDAAFVLLPTVPPEPPPGNPILLALASNPAGLALVLGLSFLAAFLVLAIPLNSLERARFERVLRQRVRVGAGAVAAGLQGDGRGGRRRGVWVPDPIAALGTKVAEVGGFQAALDKQIERAGWLVSAGEFVAISAGAVVAGFGLGILLFRSVLLALVLAVVAGLIPYILLRRAIAKRMTALNEQLPDILMVLASSMRAGHSFLQALDTVSKEIGEPSGPEFARVVAEISLGRPFEDAMNAMAERVGSEEFKWALMAVNIQREVGGNLAELLDTLAHTVRERAAVSRQVRVLSAEGRLSLRIVGALPFLVTLYVWRINPEYMSELWSSPAGWFLIAAGATLMVIGILWARKVVKIDV